ncbi:hypothetical protein L1080_025765 [Rhodococcus sp. MSC1_016]|uniref:hypothetical protein n=1 Tax=Rhodococcus sp. MSC1_016 TaxID=2909266 RepID=UPI0035B3783A
MRGRERVELALQLLLGRTAAGVPDPDRRPVRLRLRRDDLRSLRPLLAGAPVARDSDGELVAQRRHEDDPGGRRSSRPVSGMGFPSAPRT